MCLQSFGQVVPAAILCVLLSLLPDRGLGQTKENGVLCTADSDCASAYCRTGADLTNKFCFAAEMNCARENRDGAMYGDVLRNKNGVRVQCAFNRGWARFDSLQDNGQHCSDAGSCKSGYCAAGPGTPAKYCFGADMNCASWQRPGFRYGDIVETPAGRYQCDQSGGAH